MITPPTNSFSYLLYLKILFLLTDPTLLISLPAGKEGDNPYCRFSIFCCPLSVNGERVRKRGRDLENLRTRILFLFVSTVFFRGIDHGADVFYLAIVYLGARPEDITAAPAGDFDKFFTIIFDLLRSAGSH